METAVDAALDAALDAAVETAVETVAETARLPEPAGRQSAAQGCPLSVKW
ncbi:hypothetical protein ACH41H_11655 [Streptomyces sp. NPDC020800]